MDKDIVPKVSVLMPVYNAEKYVTEAIESILSQTFADFELVIINDGSTDQSEQIIKTFYDIRIKYFRNNQNLGIVDTLNKGIELCRGEYIARMDADDISLPERFQKQVDFMDANPDIGVCGTGYRYFGQKDFTLIPPTSRQQSFTQLSYNSSIGHPTSMIRISVLLNNKIRYEKHTFPSEDYALWVNLAQVSNIISLPEVYLKYRWHSNNLSVQFITRNNNHHLARIAWHEHYLNKSLAGIQKKFLENGIENWNSVRARKALITEVLHKKNRSFSKIDPVLYGKLFITQWEVGIIKKYGIAGFIYCFCHMGFRKKSKSTTFRLAYLLYKQIGKSISK